MESELESGQADQAADIYTLAMECKTLFATFLGGNGANGSHLRQYEHRFLLWASFLGVYADKNSSLDRRLRRTPEIRDLVLLMLQVLKRNLGHAISEPVTTSAITISPENQNGPIYGIKGAIDRLHRIAAIIRGGARTDELQAVQRFASKREPDGFLGVIIALTQYHFPQAQASLRFQLARSVAYRRNWLLYQQQHSRKLAKPRTPRAVPPLPIIVESEPSGQDQAPRDTYPQSEIRSQLSLTQPSIRNIDTHLLEKLDFPQQGGASQQDVTSVYSRNPPPSGLYPTQPNVLEGQRETLCKFCQNLVPKYVVENEPKWRKHVDADLRPYVCVSEHCGDFSPSFSAVRDWKSHMEEKHRSDWPRYVHRARWTCPHCPKEPEKAYFPTEAALARHLSEDATASHHPVLDAIEISRITAGCKEFNPIGEDDCPLCGPPPWQEEWKPEKKAVADVSENLANEGNLSAHFASHLRYLAFQSLRWWDVDINGEENEPTPSENAAGFNSKGSAGTATHEDSTAASINLGDEELKALQDSRALAEEKEQQERAIHIPTSVTDAARSLIPTPVSVGPMGLTGDSVDGMDDISEGPNADLCDKICDAMQENTDGKEFIPADAIASLASRGAVEAELVDIVKGDELVKVVNYVLNRPAIKVFLILVLSEYIEAMPKICDSGFGDEHLPLGEQPTTGGVKQLQPLDQDTDTSSVLSPLLSWKLVKRRRFLEKQWTFMAPIFTKDRFAHRLHPRCPLPFIPFTENDQAQNGTWGGMSSSVIEIKVHEAHQKVLQQKDRKPIRVALKTISPQMSHYFQQEEETLGVIQNIDHLHLIKPIASYQYHNHEDGCFLFPWAERGNLKEFWKTEKTRPLKTPDMMAWMLKQMCGLSEALGILHDKCRRHGDIKPENILHFEEGDYNGTLRIADVGLSKYHDDATGRREMLKGITKIITGPMRYLSPEFIQEDQIPRVFDVWALGCVFFEFLIWTLYGYNQLASFRKASYAYFREEANGSFDIHPEVRMWMSNIEKILQGSKTALESLFNLVRSQMLVPDYKKRSSSIEVYEKLVEICRDAEKDPRYLINPEVESRARTNPSQSREPPQNLALPERPLASLSPQRQGLFDVQVEEPNVGIEDLSRRAQIALNEDA